jgi:glucose-6-phosphate 1-epimerase
MSDAVSLNERFGIPGRVAFVDRDDGASVVQVTGPHGELELARQGAQLLSWTPAGMAPVVWLSPHSPFKPGKSLRGGAPVCWPWFGPHPVDAGLPAHGFARNLDWRLLESASAGDETRIVMILEPDEAQRQIWPHSATLELAIAMGRQLEVSLTTRNTGDAPFTITQALHTYFRVGDIARVRVEGLEGKAYIDKVNGSQRRQQQGPITIDQEVDRIYLDCPGETRIIDEVLGRTIHIARQNSQSCVVWNPWIEKSAALGDMGEEGYRQMLCVETTNAADDAVTIQPGQDFTLGTIYSVEGL